MCTQALKPCPFCGSKNINVHANYNKKIGRYFVFVRCDECKATGGTFACKRYYEDTDEEIWKDTSVYNAECVWDRRMKR